MDLRPADGKDGGMPARSPSNCACRRGHRSAVLGQGGHEVTPVAVQPLLVGPIGVSADEPDLERRCLSLVCALFPRSCGVRAWWGRVGLEAVVGGQRCSLSR
jgi:hypothetical protein